MPHRLRELLNPVTVTHDGELVELERGEPLAFGLLAQERTLLARSPKLHRPRGPSCLCGACDGCLARVDGVPNVMTCLTPAKGGECIETQNVLGTREHDLLAASDFLFPHGFDHHRLFAGVTGVTSVVQAFARRVAGLGKIPEQALAPRPAQYREVDAVIVGGGVAGLSAAAVLGARAVLFDDALQLGGALRIVDPNAARELVLKATTAGAELNARSTVLAMSREPLDGSGRITVLVAGPDAASVLRCRVVIVAAGTHDYAALFENNDLPGIMSARAALELWRAGVAAGRKIGLLGAGRFMTSFAELAATFVELIPLRDSSLLRAVGRNAIRGVIVEHLGGEQKIGLDALVIDGPGAPAFELSVQVGASVRFDAQHGYVPLLDNKGSAAEAVFCAGSVTGSPGLSASDGERAARSVLNLLELYA